MTFRRRARRLQRCYLAGSALLVGSLYWPLWHESGLAFRYLFEAAQVWLVLFLVPLLALRLLIRLERRARAFVRAPPAKVRAG